ncbi:MAG TPA: glycosyltransferase 87 family protein, partial [Ktedonobacterales bacterium]|nr:glycosyltransferase 87 family protein [Ktedonobacterales bacterium]
MRPLALLALALLSVVGYAALWPLLPAAQRGINSQIALVMVALAVPYAAACWLLLRGPAPVAAVWRRVEWGVLLGGALLFRAIVLPLPPVLSRDAYRYVWDALLTTHGFSPYLHGPNWPGFNAIRPPAFYPHVPFKPVPTIYPPGAQLLYHLAFAVAPLNVWAIKAEMVLFDLLAGVLLALLLRRHGRDVRRAFIYLWAPLPVIEFAFSGHVDAAAIAFILLILLLNGLSFRGSRALIGGLLGIATLIKFYPLVLVVALLRRRDWALLGTLAATLVVGYAPYAHDGLASFGFLSTYLTELDTSYGGAVLLIRAVGFRVGLTPDVVRALGVLGAAAGAGVVFWLRVRPTSEVAPTEAGGWLTRQARRGTRRWRAWDARVPRGVRLTPIQASFALIALWLAFSPHVFPWYTAALLPFVALELTLPPRRPARAFVAGAWVFCGLIPLAYVAFEYSAWYWLYAGT